MVSLSGYAQLNDEKIIIKYDPLFWKDQLKLSDDQYVKIREINYAYYQKLMDVAQQKATANHTAMKLKVDEFLEERSNQIWNTFHSRQRKKWMKMVAEQG
ncbi:hypothetical protein DQQ10_11910 [Pseudochryseolinea flava]|uniref:Uncharacterized protein n=2 Tax=Pseudochryseolinea flava TaxID=2059302 RepID=A0A364Y423_9BACT|nr:hypothetical protein DQQ10_11910 [Pseudochryseolinea flava]